MIAPRYHVAIGGPAATARKKGEAGFPETAAESRTLRKTPARTDRGGSGRASGLPSPGRLDARAAVLNDSSEGELPMVETGKPAPDFTLLDQQGKKVTLSKLKGSPVVIYFYPKDDTPGCTKEACAF